MAGEPQAIYTEQEENDDQTTQKANYLTVLKNGGFRNLWLGQVVSQVGDYFAFLATMVIVSDFSSDAQSTTLAVSGMMIAQTLPRLLFGLLSGVFVDRWDRRRTMIVADLLRAGVALAFIPAFMAHNLWAMFALGFVLSTVGTFFNPAKNALIPRLVPEHQLLSANSLSQTTMMLSVLIGPAVAGATLAVVGKGNEWIAFVVDSVTFLVSALAIYAISVPRSADTGEEVEEAREDRQGSAARQVWDELVVGLKALALNRTIATIAVVLGVTMLGVGAINVLWITFLKTAFGFQSSELALRISMLDIAFSSGMILTSLVAGNFLSHVAPKWFMFWGLLIAGLATIPLGYLPSYWLILVFMFVVGAAVSPINTGASTLMQVIVPNHQLGRVGGGLGTVIDSATLISMSLAGALGAALGIPMVFAIGGAMCVAGALLALAFIPVVTLKDRADSDPPEEASQELREEAVA